MLSMAVLQQPIRMAMGPLQHGHSDQIQAVARGSTKLRSVPKHIALTRFDGYGTVSAILPPAFYFRLEPNATSTNGVGPSFLFRRNALALLLNL